MPDVRETLSEMKDLYLAGERPWVIGYSGGKDSTCVTQMAFQMLTEMSPEERHKEIHVISNDTLIENPIISKKIKKSVRRMNETARRKDLPIKAKRLKPKLEDRFWVNLIGRGYPSPNRWFRWCTDRLKIKPTTSYIEEQIEKKGEVIVLLGARKSESASRSHTMKDYEIPDYNLRKHTDIERAFIYTPIEDFHFKEVWSYLKQVGSFWGDDHQELIALYKEADDTCPMQVDKSTSPCGGSRFGCWACTVVEKDKSAEGLIKRGKDWLKPLLEFRNWLKEIRNDSSKRQAMRKKDQKRKVKAEVVGNEFEQTERYGHKVLGPFTFEIRHEILRRLMDLQEKMSQRNLCLISPEELKAIETVWVYEGDNITSLGDVLNPEGTYESTNDEMIQKEKTDIPSEVAEKFEISPTLIEKLLIVEKDLSNLSRRTGIYNRLENIIKKQAMKELSGGN